MVRADRPRAGRIHVGLSSVTPGFFKTVGLPLESGRDFVDGDVAAAVTIVSESAAGALWPGDHALGQRLLLEPNEWTTVVGVTADPISASLDNRGERAAANFVFRPVTDGLGATGTVIVRAQSPAARLEQLRRTISAVDQDALIFNTQTAEEARYAQYGDIWATTVLAGSMGALALAIAMLGIYGVVSYFVSTRTREFGIRLALGATPRGIVQLALGHARFIVLVGLLSGVFVTSVASRLVEARRFGLMPNSISTWIWLPLVLMTAGLIAGYLPARRAGRVDPNVALRSL